MSLFSIIIIYIFSLLQFRLFAMADTNGNTKNMEDVDRIALLAIKDGISSDPLGVMNSWSYNQTLHLCNWHGVTCGRRHQRVTKLVLQSSKLKGTLSPYIGNLSFLVEVNLKNNSFRGTIPPEIGKLRRLQVFLLSNNSFGGEIPNNLSSCSRLYDIEIQFNELVGPIPPELGSLSNLEALYLRHNHLTGTIPSSLGNLSSLIDLTLAENHLIGKIPDSLGSFKSIRLFSLHTNNLTGVVPPSIFNSSSLTIFELDQNHLKGTLPTELGTMLPRITVFNIGKNRFVGSLPISLSNSSHLEVLEVGDNFFHGPIPLLAKSKNLRRFSIYSNSFGTEKSSDLNFFSSLRNNTMLDILQIGGNNLSGIFPETLCNLSMLSFLSLADNKISGKIPSCIGNLEYLEQFYALNNLLSGVIPSSIGNLPKLGKLFLGSNQLSGSIPTSVGNMTQIIAFSMYANNLQGHIPSNIGDCINLQELDLSQNSLSGRIPSQIFRLPTLSIGIYLDSNNLYGPIPTEVGQLVHATQLYLSENKLSGEIPSTLSACSSLQQLDLHGNNFEGSIPSALVSLNGLTGLDLSRNNLSGNIPKFLASLKLEILDLSHNNFEGELPTNGVFANSTAFSVLGNERVCGGIPILKLHKCNFTSKITKRRTNNGGKFIFIIIFGVLGVIFFIVLVSLYTFLYRKKTQAPKPPCDLENTFTNLFYRTLLKATNGFSSENLIGNGTFGDVYKGILDEDQTTVAIKKFKLERKIAFKSFISECRALQNIRHRNLVKVITACSSIDHHGNDFKALVFEYMENGSLHDWLHPKPILDNIDSLRLLNVFDRFSIATDIAFALEYLHHRCGTPIVHCDLKPNNVLLNNQMTAFVGDFGLAKFLSRPNVVVSNENQSSTIGIRGTVGYAPPEYGMGNEVSTQGDVYSFGILLLELFTGKMPVDDMFKEGLNLHKYIKSALPDQITDILDHHLYDELVGHENNRDEVTHAQSSSRETNRRSTMLESLISVLEIAITCTNENPQKRIHMSDVSSKLSSLKITLLGTRSQQRRTNLAG